MSKKKEEQSQYTFKATLLIERIDERTDFLKVMKENYLVQAVSLMDVESKLLEVMSFGADGECRVAQAVPENISAPILAFNREGNAPLELDEIKPMFEAKVSRWTGYSDSGAPMDVVKERFLIHADLLAIAESVVKAELRSYSNENVSWKFRIHSIKEYEISGIVGFDKSDVKCYFRLKETDVPIPVTIKEEKSKTR